MRENLFFSQNVSFFLPNTESLFFSFIHSKLLVLWEIFTSCLHWLYTVNSLNRIETWTLIWCPYCLKWDVLFQTFSVRYFKEILILIKCVHDLDFNLNFFPFSCSQSTNSKNMLVKSSSHPCFWCMFTDCHWIISNMASSEFHI